MADVGIDILDAISSRLATYTAAGQTLEDIRQYYVKYSEYDMPPDFGNAFPLLMVDMLPQSYEIVSIPACMTRKEYPVRYKVYTEQAGLYTDKTAAQLIDLVEDVFAQVTFGISTLLCHHTGKDYSLPAEIEFAARLNGAAALYYTYVYTDTRAIP
jgi:hypothetical protein